MAHFTKLDENNIVVEVIVVANNTIDSNNEETSGIAFLTQWSGGYSNWKQTSYNGKIRYNYAGIGYTYDAARDAFIAPKPFNSWVLDEATCRWQAPTPMPTTEGKIYYWSEDDLSWRERL